jgi:hypothetical protein
MVAADAGFYSSKNEKAGQALGVRWIKSGGRGRRGESVCSNEDTGYVVASIPGWRACGDGWAWA